MTSRFEPGSMQAKSRGNERLRKRMTHPAMKLSFDAPLKRLSSEELKRLDAEAVLHDDKCKAFGADQLTPRESRRP
jgi:hypothetical protein